MAWLNRSSFIAIALIALMTMAFLMLTIPVMSSWMAGWGIFGWDWQFCGGQGWGSGLWWPWGRCGAYW